MLGPVLASANETRAKVGDVIAGRYELRESMGAGPLCRVFLAWDRERRHSCALKLFDVAAPSAEAFRRYGEAIRSASAANHTAVVLPQTPASAGGPRFAVGEALKGIDLEGLRARGGALQWPRAAEIASACADALAAVHEATGLAHRALKPGNVWITEASQIRVLDFGVAELGLAPAPPRSGVFVEYRAPEQIEGGPGDARSDVFTLAVLLFEMTTGVHPFTGPSAFKAAHKALQSTPALDTPGLPALARPLLARALARRPEERHADVREFLRALTVVRQSVGSAAPRVNPGQREAAADEAETPAQPVVDSTTQIRIPVPRSRPPLAAFAGASKVSTFAPPVAPDTAGPATEEPALLGTGGSPAAPRTVNAMTPSAPRSIASPSAERLPALGDAVLQPPSRSETPQGDTDRLGPGPGDTTLEVITERTPPREPAEATVALAEIKNLSERPGNGTAADEDAATIAMPALRPRAPARSEPDEATVADNMSQRPGQRPEPAASRPQPGPAVKDEATLADARAVFRRPGPHPGEETLTLTDAPRHAANAQRQSVSEDMPPRTSQFGEPRSDVGTVHLPGGLRQPDATLALSDAEALAQRAQLRDRVRSPEESTQVLTDLGAQVRATAARRAPASDPPLQPIDPTPWLSPRMLVLVNVALGTLILAALLTLLLR